MLYNDFAVLYIHDVNFSLYDLFDFPDFVRSNVRSSDGMVFLVGAPNKELVPLDVCMALSEYIWYDYEGTYISVCPLVPPGIIDFDAD